MAKPIKAFLGKRYTNEKTGITKAYLYNPEVERYGWYNVNEHITEFGSTFIDDSDVYIDPEKVETLRTNIKTVLREVADKHTTEGIDELIDKMFEEINNMSDIEIDTFANNNKNVIQLYFEYKDCNEAGIDARIIKIANQLGIDPYDYIEKEKVPERVQNILNNINEVVAFHKEFDDSSLNITRASYAHLTGRNLRE